MNTDDRFAGMVALVTGGASGIGAAVTRRLAAEGCEAVIIADLDKDGASAIAADWPTVRPAFVDVSHAVDVDAVIDETVAEYGQAGRGRPRRRRRRPRVEGGAQPGASETVSPSMRCGSSATKPGAG